MRLHTSIHPDHFGLTPNAKPVRHKRRGRTPGYSGTFGSKKTAGRISPFESLLERDLQSLLNADPNITEYAAQPHTLSYWARDDHGRSVPRTYTPDAVALTRAGEILIFEAKAGVFAAMAAWRAVEPHIREAYRRDHGATLVVLTEAEIRAQPRLSNCEIMLSHREPGNDPADELMVSMIVCAASAPLTIEAVTAAAVEEDLSEDRTFAALMRLALAGMLSFDQSTALTSSALVYPGV